MPITDPSLPPRLLNALQDSGESFVVLHGEAKIGTGSLESDLDLAVKHPPDDVIRLAAKRLRAVDLHPVIRWRYDIGGTVAFFLCTGLGEHGIQVDMLYDPKGLGRYGVRSNKILEHAVTGERYPVPSPLDERLYLVHKRWRKEQQTALESELDSLRESGNVNDAYKRVPQLFSTQAAKSMNQLLNGRWPTRSSMRIQPSELKRRLERTLTPIGYWVDIVGPQSQGQRLAQNLRFLFEGWAIHLDTGERPVGMARYAWWAREVMPIRLRPGVFVSHSRSRAHPGADLTIDWHSKLSIEDAARSIVEAMTARFSL